jgi:AraC family transcriptional regulator
MTETRLPPARITLETAAQTIRWAENGGLSAEDAAGSSWRTGVHPDGIDRHLDEWRVCVASINEHAPRTLKSDASLAVQAGSPIDGGSNEGPDRDPLPRQRCNAIADVIQSAVEISPQDLVTRRAVTGHGMAAESVAWTRQPSVKCRFRAPLHLLVAHERGERHDGETFVEGLPRSKLRTFARKLTFVPAGHEYHEWTEPCTRTSLMYFYFDPAKLKIHSEPGMASLSLGPRLFFENATLWDTAVKLKTLVESPASVDRFYFEALGIVLVHELVRLNRGIPSIESQVQGGLAKWAQQIVSAYIEEHLAERLPIAALARLVRLSPYHFCKVFKQSFGIPPHRYQINRRIERAKLLLAEPAVSITDIGLAMGFASSSAFATAFRKATGLAPIAYRREFGGL